MAGSKVSAIFVSGADTSDTLDTSGRDKEERTSIPSRGMASEKHDHSWLPSDWALPCGFREYFGGMSL